MPKKPLKEIPNSLVVEALQIVSNFCNQNAWNSCNDCYLRMEDQTCLMRAELPERFKRWKDEKGL